ncbi:MAG: hypothetical protein ACI4SC_04400 [Candidatus Neoclostridium sp.]
MKEKNIKEEKNGVQSACDFASLESKIDALETKINEFYDKSIAVSAALTETVSALLCKVDALYSGESALRGAVEKLRDQTFALGMAEVNQDGQIKNESYNNLILDETCALRLDVDGLKAEINKLKEQNAKLEIVSETDKKVEKLISSVGEVLSSVDDVKAGMELRSLNDDEPNAENTLESKDNLSRSIDELKKELSKIVSDIS